MVVCGCMLRFEVRRGLVEGGGGRRTGLENFERIMDGCFECIDWLRMYCAERHGSM